MNTVTGVIANNKTGKYAIIERTPIKQFNLNLGDKNVWWVGFDPASRYSGIALLAKDKSFVILLDCKRDVNQLKEQYYEDLYLLLKRLVAGKKVERLVNEKPFTKGKYARASEVLLTLRGKIEIWAKMIPEFAESEFAQINVNAWKSRVLDKTKGKNRFNAQGAVADDLCDAFPALLPYRNMLQGGDLDSFDALGAIIGYDLYAYSGTGSERICGEKERSHKSFVGYLWWRIEEFTPENIRNFFGEAYPIFKPRVLDYNEEYSLNENVMMASTKYDAVMTILPESQLQPLQWKFGEDFTDENKVMLMFVFRRGKFTVREGECLRKLFSMHEEIGGL